MKTCTLEELKTVNSSKIASAVKGQKGLQTPLEMAARHVAEHGDYTICYPVIQQWLDEGTEEGGNLSHEAAAGIKWFTKYCGLTYDQEAKNFTGWQGKEFIKANFKKGQANPYYKGISIAKPFAFDLDTEIQKLIGRANAAMKKGAANETLEVNVDTTHMEALKAIKLVA